MRLPESPSVQTHVLLSELVIGESPRWHADRLWLAHWGAGEILAVDLEGNREVVAQGPKGLGWSIDWLADGRLLVTGPELLRQEPDGTMVQHADLSGVADHGWNEIVVDGRGNIYLNGQGFRFGEDAFRPGVIALVTPDGAARQVADEIAFPNGMAVTPDNATLVVAESFARRLTAFDIADDGSLFNRRAWAEDVGPDGICIDADRAVWTGGGAGGCVRVREGGPPTDAVEHDGMPFACMLGGPERRTLFILAADWHMNEDPAANIARLTTGPRTGRVLTAPAPAPGAGWPGPRGEAGRSVGESHAD
jgi:sugar lactone lactonase YvrE